MNKKSDVGVGARKKERRKKKSDTAPRPLLGGCLVLIVVQSVTLLVLQFGPSIDERGAGFQNNRKSNIAEKETHGPEWNPFIKSGYL